MGAAARLLAVCTALAVLTACHNGGGTREKLADLAYEQGGRSEYRVYLDEAGAFVPYLVLTSDYGGQTLLLREHVLSEQMPYNESTQDSGYYENSLIDAYLDSEFLRVFPDGLREQIVDSSIVITYTDSLQVCGDETTTITRKVFLLSHTELGLTEHAAATVEGLALKYFSTPQSRMATNDSGTAAGWWLRSAYTVYGNTAWCLSGKAVTGGEGVYYANGIRPAFCLSGDTGIETREDIIQGRTVYALPG